jgi:hypothetical protein
MPNVEIRFNTKFPEGKSKYEWRVLVDGKENLVNEIRIDCPSYTSERFIEGEGVKYHISANADSVEILEQAGITYAYIK